MPAAYSVPADGPDVYRNFVIPTNLTEDKWVRRHRGEALGAHRGAPLAVLLRHHRQARASRMAVDGQPGFPGFGTIFTVRGSANAR